MVTIHHNFPIPFLEWYFDRIRKYGKTNIRVVIVCSSRKDPEAGHMMTKKKHPIKFVADPKEANKTCRKNSLVYAHPDDDAGAGHSWRESLCEYNRKYCLDPSSNTSGLFPAWQLYADPTYSKLVSTFGIQNVFILSAGWGLISADFLTPNYDITFSKNAAKDSPWVLRQEADNYKDLMMLPRDTDKPVIFLGGKEYVPFFNRLTKDIKSKRIVFYYSTKPPDTRGRRVRLFQFHTHYPRNWYYECGKQLCRVEKELIESENARRGGYYGKA